MAARFAFCTAFVFLAADCGSSGPYAALNADMAPAAAYDLGMAQNTSDLGASSSDMGTWIDAAVAGRRFPDTTSTISLLVDQLPAGMTAEQQKFVVAHYVGSQKLTLDISQPLRALSPGFLVLHYHLAIWQSAPGVNFILDGKTWSNDYPMVTPHEPWFWHNELAQRVASNVDKKLLMNLADPGFVAYWQSSIVAQVQAGDYDGVFADSASPALLSFEAQLPPDPRIGGTGVRDTVIPALGNRTYIKTWESFMSTLDAALGARGIPLIPNTGAFVTTWDNTRYDLTAGVFVEGFADPRFSLDDWKASTNQLLALAMKNKIIVLQNYLSSANDLAKRRYYLANYLLIKGSRTYLDYFEKSALEWYPEWSVDLGTPQKTGVTVDDFLVGGVYERDFQKGIVLVNPSSSSVTVKFTAPLMRVEPSGGGAVPMGGATPGTIGMTTLMSVVVPPGGAEIFLK